MSSPSRSRVTRSVMNVFASAMKSEPGEYSGSAKTPASPVRHHRCGE